MAVIIGTRTWGLVMRICVHMTSLLPPSVAVASSSAPCGSIGVSCGKVGVSSSSGEGVSIPRDFLISSSTCSSGASCSRNLASAHLTTGCPEKYFQNTFFLWNPPFKAWNVFIGVLGKSWCEKDENGESHHISAIRFLSKMERAIFLSLPQKARCIYQTDPAFFEMGYTIRDQCHQCSKGCSMMGYKERRRGSTASMG